MTAQKDHEGLEEGRARTVWPSVTLAAGAALRPRILLAEDDAEMRAFLAWSLRREHYEVTECVDGLDLISKLGSFILFGEPAGFDLVISDIRMPGVTALEILEAMRDCEGLPAVILITGFGDAQTHDEAARLGVVALFDKPFEIDALLATARELFGTGWTSGPRGRAKARLAAAETRLRNNGATPSSRSVSQGAGECNEKEDP